MIAKIRAWGRSVPLVSLLGLAALAGVLLWSYWPTWSAMSHQWSHDPVYSHGYLVPFFALALLWFRRQKLATLTLQSDWWAGCGLLLIGVVIRLAGAYFYFPWLDAFSLLPCLAGLCLLLAGRSCLAWSWPAIAFLFFMMPLPYRVETALRQPLQRSATQVSTYVLQTLGCPAFAEGNIIVLKNIHLGVEEACSGLSMLLVFFALSTAVALVIRRPLWERGLILLSAAPIAIAANVARITATGLLYQWGKSKEGQMVFHDWAGWLMMPLGLILIGIELKMLERLLITPRASQPLPISLARPAVPTIHGSKKKAGKRHRRQKA